MEQSIRNLDESTDEATKMMLQKVVDKRRKYTRLKGQHLIVLWLTSIIACLFFLYVYETIIQPYGYSFAAMFSAFIQKTEHLYMLFVFIGGYGTMNLLRTKRDDAEQEYDELRCEIIDKSSDLWCDKDAWKQRHRVYEMMLQKYDINLYHESD